MAPTSEDRIHNHVLDATETHPTLFTVVAARIFANQQRRTKASRGVCKIKSVLADVLLILGRIPFELHAP